MIWGYSPVSFFVKRRFPDNEFFEFNGDGELFPVGILDFEEVTNFSLKPLMGKVEFGQAKYR